MKSLSKSRASGGWSRRSSPHRPQQSARRTSGPTGESARGRVESITALSRFAHLDHTPVKAQGRRPGDVDGAFDTLMRGATFGVHAQRTLDRLALFWRCGQIVVQSDRFNPNRSTYANTPTIHATCELRALGGQLC